MIWPDYKSFSDLNTAFYDIAKRAGGTWLMLTTSLATAFAWGIANSLAAQAAVSRLLFSMARDKNLPSFLSKVHPKYKTPYIATIFIAIISAIFVTIYSNKIADLTSVINFGALTSFLVLHITVIVYFIKNKLSLNIWRYIISPVLGFSVIFYVWINLNNNAKILGGLWIGIGIIYYIILRFVFKKKVENLGI